MDLIVPFTRLTAARLEFIIARQIGVAESVSAGTLAFVREIQTRMDPASVPQWNGYQLAVYCKPGLERSGDIFDVVSLPNAFGALAVGNVEGESTPVAMDMTQMRASFRYACLHLDAPHIFMRAANWMLCEERSGCRMHCVSVVINPESGELEYCAAGNIGGVIVDRRGNAQSLTEAEAPALGAVPGVAYESQRTQLLPDETLALFSGGCCTICSADGKPLGREQFTDSICDGYGQSATTLLDELVQDLAPFFKQGRQPDDITILLLHRVAAAP
jgi:serine phosphatase RsbU (regulator of sigma subunit)